MSTVEIASGLIAAPAITFIGSAYMLYAFFTKDGRSSGAWITATVICVPGVSIALFFFIDVMTELLTIFR